MRGDPATTEMQKVRRLTTCLAVLIGVLGNGKNAYGQLSDIYQKQETGREQLEQKCYPFHQNAQYSEPYTGDSVRFFIDSDPKQTVWKTVVSFEGCKIYRLGSMSVETTKERRNYGRTVWTQTQFGIDGDGLVRYTRFKYNGWNGYTEVSAKRLGIKR